MIFIDVELIEIQSNIFGFMLVAYDRGPSLGLLVSTNFPPHPYYDPLLLLV